MSPTKPSATHSNLWSLNVTLNPLKTVQQSFECKIMSSLEGSCICTVQDMAIVMKFGLKA